MRLQHRIWHVAAVFLYLFQACFQGLEGKFWDLLKALSEEIPERDRVPKSKLYVGLAPCILITEFLATQWSRREVQKTPKTNRKK